MRKDRPSLVRKHRGRTTNSKCTESIHVKNMLHLAEEMYRWYEDDPRAKTVRTVSYTYILTKLKNQKIAKDFVEYINPLWTEKNGDSITYIIDQKRRCLIVSPTSSAVKARFWIIANKRNGNEKLNRITQYTLRNTAEFGRKGYSIIFYYRYIGLFYKIPGSSGEYWTNIG